MPVFFFLEGISSKLQSRRPRDRELGHILLYFRPFLDTRVNPNTILAAGLTVVGSFEHCDISVGS